MARRPIHVFPDGDVWVVKREDSERASAVTDTKREALEKAASIARNHNLSVVVHGSDGRIQRNYRPSDAAADGDCFLTTACVRHHGLRDDCYELQTLRRFRDSYMLASPSRVALVQEYYRRAPGLIEQLNKRRDSDFILAEVFDRIRAACRAIDKGEMRMAQFIYVDAMRWLDALLK